MPGNTMIKPYIIYECAGCGRKRLEGVAVCSSFGATTLSFCCECINAGRDSYREMVRYIASAGRFPEDINKEFQDEVRRQLILHNKTEEEFIHDVNSEIDEEIEFFKLHARID